ncbi:MAG: kinase [Trebouxia sp. A1-2]|nr:MAG: kinase [Trebouxia sp. A1-2]
MRKSASRKNLDNAGDGEGSLHGMKGISRSLSNVKLNKTFGKAEADTYWAQDCYPVSVADYELIHVVGKGASATVWLANCIPMEKTVAIKLMDLENFGANLDIVMREAMVMRQQRHPNVLPLLAAFLSEAVLWMVMPYVAGGSAIHILNKKCPGGYEESVIATIGKAVLSGLHYMHPRGFIHRDIKGENVLVGEDGNVMLADFGVTAAMEPRPNSPKAGSSPSGFEPSSGASSLQRSDTASSERSYHCYLERHTFVGTPCFMAPEVMEQEGYYQAADIWAFGILLMELATGHAPYANFSLTNIIIMTMHSPVPELERTFSDHSSGSHFGGGSTRNKTIGRGMRSISSKKNVQYNAMHAVLASNAFDGKKILKKVTKGTWTNKGCTIDPCSLVNAAGVAFTTLRRMEGSTQGFGNGFVLARMGGENGEPLSWSAPSYFDLMVPGGGAEFSKVELCFVVPDDTTLNLFTKGSIGMELPKSRDVELGLASRSDLLQILNHTVHGGKSVLGNDQQDSDNSRRLDRSLFPSSSEGQIQHLHPAATPTDSPGGLFRMDSSPSGLVSSSSALFPTRVAPKKPWQSTSDNPVAAAASSVKSKGVFKKLFSKKDKS